MISGMLLIAAWTILGLFAVAMLCMILKEAGLWGLIMIVTGTALVMMSLFVVSGGLAS